MKVSWLQRLRKGTRMWTEIAKKTMPCMDDLLCYGTCKLKVIRDKISNPFWKDVIISLIDFYKAYKPDNDELATAKIWFSNIAKYKKSVVRNWDDRGIRFLSDLIDADLGGIMSREKIQTKFNVRMTFLCYSSLIRSLPKHVKSRSFKPMINLPILPYQIAIMNGKTKLSRIVYSTIIADLQKNQSNVENKNEQKWLRDINGMYRGTMRSVCAVTKNTYMQSFHFRIISRIIATNKFLNTIGIAPEPLCDFCGIEVEDIVHLFWSCIHIKQFIETVKEYVLQTFDLRLEPTKKLWFFPKLGKLKPIEVIIITVAKAVIYASKRRNKSPTLQHFQATLCLEAKKEHGSAVMKGTPDVFNNKWGRVATII